MIKPKSKPKKLINLENCMKTIHEEKKAAMIKLQPKISSQIGWEARLAGRPGWLGEIGEILLRLGKKQTKKNEVKSFR